MSSIFITFAFDYSVSGFTMCKSGQMSTPDLGQPSMTVFFITNFSTLSIDSLKICFCQFSLDKTPEEKIHTNGKKQI